MNIVLRAKEYANLKLKAASAVVERFGNKMLTRDTAFFARNAVKNLEFLRPEFEKNDIEFSEEWFKAEMGATWKYDDANGRHDEEFSGKARYFFKNREDEFMGGCYNPAYGGDIYILPTELPFGRATRAHEMAHKITHGVDENGQDFVGFRRGAGADRKGVGLNEGATEMLCEKLLGRKFGALECGYPKEKKQAEKICAMVGEKVFFADMFFCTGEVEKAMRRAKEQELER
jgi:hypothetical protein